MPGKFDHKLFKLIFSDAHVVDVDFSQWDKIISICVVADHVEVTPPPRLPIFLVEFLRVNKFYLTLNHLEVEMEDASKHFQWNIDEFKIKENNNKINIMLYGSKTWPYLEIECEGINFRKISNTTLDKLFPGWNTPYKGLVRPGIGEKS